MTEGLNRCLLMGNLCADPDLKTFQGGSVLKLRLACNESYFDQKSNSRKDRTEYVNVTIWNKRGEALAKFLQKGDRLFVEGRLQTSSWEKDGQKHWRTEVVATNVILGGKSSGRRELQGEGPAPATYEPPSAEDFGAGFDGEDDIPFDGASSGF